MKKLFAVFALIILAVTPLCLVGCKSKYADLSIEIEENFNIVLGQDENDSITVQARVTGANDENGGKLSFSPDNDRLVKISQEYRNGINYITLKALAPGKVNIEARTLEGGVTKNFSVNIIQPIRNFSIKNGNFVVVRGGEWKIDVEKNLNLEPTNTTQTNFVVSFAANQDIDGLGIEDNILRVSKDTRQEEIVLSVSSVDNEDIAPKEIKLSVLDDFVEVDKRTQANQSRFDAGDILVFEKNESMLSYDKLEEMNVMSNLLSQSEKQVVVRVYATKKVEVASVENSRLSIKNVSVLENFDTAGKLEYTDFIFSVRFSDIVSSGTTTNLSFVAKYSDFDLSKSLSPIKVTYELAPKTLLVNEQDDLNEFTLYNFYSTARKGQRLQFGILPTSVSSANSKMILVNKDNLVDAFDYIQFFRSNGEELFENDEINANEIIYARAKSGVLTGSYEVVLQTKFVNPQTHAPISKVLKFDVLAGITSMEFADQEQINLQLNSTQNSANVVFDVKPANVDITKIHIEEVDGLSFSNIAIQSQMLDGVSLKFVVQAQKVGNCKIKVFSENGIEIIKTISVVNALESVVLSAPSPNENSIVGDRQVIDGELRYVAVAVGGAITLGESILPEDGQYRVEYSYFESEGMPEFALSSYEYPTPVTSTSMSVLDYSQLLAYNKVVVLKQGYAVVRAKYVPIGIVDNSEAELEPIFKYFVIQGYKPIRSVVLSSNYETLYSLKSVGAYNKNLTMTRVSLSVYPNDATYAKNIEWTYDGRGEYFDFDEKTLTVYAKNSYGGTISIVATIRELNRTYTQSLSVTIVDAKTVSNISVNGISDSIYIENTDDSDKTYRINAVAFPNDAFNTKLRYDFVDQAGNVFGDITISEDGMMNIPAGVGVGGFVRIAAEDCFQENSSTGEYEPIGVEGKNIILIPTTIANGTSKETAIFINSLEELKNIDTKKHYIIYNDLDVSGISFDNFSGGLYGRGENARTVLSGFDRTFIKTLAKNGCIEDFEINCNASLLGDNGVLVGKNEGVVNNVVVRGNWTGALSLVKNNSGKISGVVSEVVFDGEKFAGICGVNLGEIVDCKFMGSITASNQAAGIVLTNSGRVEETSTLILETSSFNLAADYVSLARIAGVCVENQRGGIIARSYVHSYKSNSAFVATDATKICGFVHTNDGTIQKCFSALNELDLVCGFVCVNNANATIENCYSNTTFASFNYGTIQKCFSVLDDERLNSATDCYSGSSATEKTVSAWLKTNWDISCTYEAMTIWKIYLDSQNPFLREVVAEVKPESMSISVKEQKTTNSYIKLGENQVVLYYYSSNVSPLSIAEKAKLNALNSISIYDLLTFEILPFSASSSPEMFNYTLSDGSAIEMSGLGIKILGLGKQTLTITPKLNPELSFTLDIFTSYPIRDFNIFASASSIDPSNALSNDSKIYLKRSRTQPLYAKVSSSIVLVDRKIEYKTFDLKMNYGNASEVTPLGLYIVALEQTVEDYVCALDFSNVSTYDEFEEIKSTLSSCFERVFEVVVYNGAESLLASQYSFEMEPIDSIEFEVSLKTDLFGDDEELTKEGLSEILIEVFEDSDSKQIIKYEIFSSTGVNLTSEYFHFDYEISDFDKYADSNGFRTYKITLGLRLKEKTTQIGGDYYIRIYPNEVGNVAFTLSPIDISLKLLPQSLQRIDYSHYYAESTVQNQKEVLKTNTTPSNALAPGQVGLLEVNLFPTYSEISHVEIESISNQGYVVKLQLYQRKDVNNLSEFVMVQQNADYNRTENGIVVGYTMISNGTIYVKTQVSSNIPEELVFEIVVRAYRTKDDQNPIVQHAFLAAKFIPSATVEIDGQKDYVVMGRGTTKDMTISVIGEGDVSVVVDDNQTSINAFERVYAGKTNLVEKINVGTQNKYIWTCPIVVGSKFENNGKNDIVTIRVVVSRNVNGVKEKKTTFLTIRVLDFVVDNVVLTNGTNKFDSKVSVKSKFNFSFDIPEPQAFTNESEDIEAVENLKQKIENFKNAQYFTDFGDEGGAYIYDKSFMYVDTAGDHSFAIKNDGGYVFDKNEYVEFDDVLANEDYLYTTVTGLKTGTQKMKLKVSALSNDQERAEIYSITYDFDIVVTNYSNEDKPMPVGSLVDFNAIFEQADAQDYILTNDIEISDHVIYSDTSKIRSLDGNNHKIIIKSLNLGTNQSLEVALFNTISETTTIKNLIVDYQIGEINANSDQFSNISVAGLALENQGIVTNTHVLSSKGTSTQTTGGLQISTAVSQSTQIQMAGFVLDNNGSITNSRVGDSTLEIVGTQGQTEEKALKIFALVGQDQMAGFVLNNSGIISASFAKNIKIVNNSKFATNNQTAGFVLNNQSNAKITGCYVRGVESLDQSKVYVLGDGIESSFEIAGFVYDNYSYISDSYSNIKLYKEATSQNLTGLRAAGFVFRNQFGAQIVSSLSLSKIVENDTSQQHFCGIDEQNESNNNGTIVYSYYYCADGRVQSIADGAELLDDTAIKQEDKYYGYSFTTLGAFDGMWFMTERGPDLVSANNIALSKRYLISTEEDKYDVAYVVGYEYGSANNPILIRSATEFNEVFGISKDDSIKKYFDANDKQAFGNYRLINDIDLKDLSLGGEEVATLSSTSFTLTRKTNEFGGVVGFGVLEGNSMTISNLDLSITDANQTSFGLFAAITNGAVVKNLNLTVEAISASTINYVGSLAGIVEDSKVINVSAQIAQGQQIALVQGKNVVGGIVGAVSGTSELNNISSSISAHATYVDSTEASSVNNNTNGTEEKDDDVCVQVAIPKLPIEGASLNSNVSVAGSVAGAVYAKDLNNPNNKDLSIIDYAQVQKIKSSGKFSVNAKIVGGLIGYVGKATYVHDAWLAISDGQNINAHENGVGGGAVGVSYGKLSHIRIEHNDVQDYSASAQNLQTEIDAGVQDYYSGKSSERRTYENMFASTNGGQTLGGIVGVMNGGIIEDSYTKLDVISDAAYNLGGIVGIIKNQSYEISRVYTFSNVQSKSSERNVLVGGLFGAVLSTGELDTVVGANYLDKNYTVEKNANPKYVAFAPFAGACTYIPKLANVYTLSKIWNSDKKEQEIAGNVGAKIISAKTVNTLQVSLADLFPAKDHAQGVNEVFEIEDSHFKNAFWSRNVDDVLPHLTFGLESQFFVIDSVDTAGDIRKMIKNSNKLFYVDGRVDLNKEEVVRAIKQVRESIIFTGSLLGIPDDMRTNIDETPTLIGLDELFDSAIAATFADFCIENPRTSSVELPSENYGIVVGYAKDCVFRNIKIVGEEGKTIESNSNQRTKENSGALVGFADGKTSFEAIVVQNIHIVATGEKNVGLIVGKTSANINKTIFKNCSVLDCSIKNGNSEKYIEEHVGGFVGYSANSVSIVSTNKTLGEAEKKADGIHDVVIDVKAQYVGGLVGNCEGVVGISNMRISHISIEVNANHEDAYVGGLVGFAEKFELSLISDVIMQKSDEESDENAKTIELQNGDKAWVGGIVGKVNTNISIDSQDVKIKFQTNNMSVSAKDVYAGGIAGEVGESVSVSKLLVNTQGNIKNKVLKISCPGNTYVGGLVGLTQNAKISGCWSGTDVEIDNVTESKSQVSFGGIVGEVQGATDTGINSNSSYGRFYISEKSINTLNAGGIVGKITATKQAEVKDNKTLTSLEIKRLAKKHNVNAVAGSRTNVTGGNNAYTYQLSLALEDTDFADNKSTSKEVLNDKNAKEGSILNPKGISRDTTIVDGNYYKVDSSSSAITLTFPTWGEGETEKNFVLIGDGKTIEIATPHADKLGSRTIISGVTIEGKFDYDVSASEVEINETTYSVNSNGLTSGGKTYKFNTKSEIGDNLSNGITLETESKHYCEINNFQSLVTIDDQKTSIRYISRKQQNQNPQTDIAREGDSYSGFETKEFWVANSRGKSYVFEKSVNNQDHYGTMRACEEITVYYFTWNAGGSYGDILIAWSDEDVLQDDNGDYIGYGGGVYKFYLKIDENDEMTATLTYDNGVKQECAVNTITYHVIDDEKINVYDKEEVSYYYNGELINITEDKLGDFSVVNIGSQEYAAQIDDGGVVKSVAPILYSSTVTLGNKIYTYKDKVFYDSEGMAVANLIDSNKYVQKSGFIGENNGFIFGVVVKSNYMSSNFGGFVSTNNGIIKYSSMNGQVFNTSSDKDVAGFVLDNNGIIDYCHSTGAVQGSAKNSYSFGVNNAGGALTNSYTIMLNEVGVNESGKKSVFANNVGTFSNNEYDPIGTEVDCTMRGVSELTDICISPSDVADKNSKITDKFWGYKFEEIKLFNSTISNIFCNYGYKTLSRGAFENITHLSMLTGSGICLKNGNDEIYYNNPIVIANSRMLSKIEEIGLGKAYVLANNIDLSKNSITKNNWGNVGLNSNDGNGFTGVFDGNNKTISNLVYQNYRGTLPEVEAKKEYKPNAYDENENAPSNSEVYGGLFAKTTGATIKNLTLNNIRIGIATNSNVSDSHSAYSGALIAKATDTKISNIKIEASDVNASAQNKSYVGGVVGLIDNANSLLLISDIYIDKSTSIISQNTMCAGDYESSSWVGFDSKNTASGYCAYSGGVAGFVNNRDIINEDSCNILTTSSSKVMQVAYFNINDNNGLIGKDFLPNSFHVNVANNSGAYYRDEFIEVDSSETKTYYSAYSYDGKLCGSHCSYHEACYSYAYTDSFTFSIYNYEGERDGFDGPYNNAITQKRGGFVLFVAECYGYNGSDNSGNIAAPSNWIGEWKIVEGGKGYPESKDINGIECYRYGIEETNNHKVYVPTTFIIPKVYYNSSIENGTSSRMLEAGENYHVNIYHEWRAKEFSFSASN